MVEDKQSGERHLRVMNDIARIASGELELRPMLVRVTEALWAHFGWEFIAFASVDSLSQRFICEAVHSKLPTEVTPGFTRPLTLGVVGEVARTGKAALYDDVSRAPNYLETTADQLAGAIDSARIHAALHEHSRVMEILNRISRLATQSDDLHALLRQVTDYLAAELNVAAASVLVLDESGKRFIIETMSGEVSLGVPGGGEWFTDVGVCGRCARTGEPQLVYADVPDPDYVPGHPDIRSEYVVPILYHGRTLGVLNVESTARESFTPQVQSLCRAVADQIAGAIHLAIVNRELAETNAKLKRANLELHR